MELLTQQQNRMVQIMEMNMGNIVKIIAALIAAIWGGLAPMVQLLLGLMVLDILTGLLVGFGTKTLASCIAFNGMVKKALILCVVAMGMVLQYYSKLAIPAMGDVDIPLTAMIAGFFSASEGLSVLENAAAAGVPIPQFLRDALARLNPSKG